MTFYWRIDVEKDSSGEDEPAERTIKGSGVLHELQSAIAREALELESDEVLSISVDPITVREEA